MSYILIEHDRNVIRYNILLRYIEMASNTVLVNSCQVSALQPGTVAARSKA
jgi:hypothetical protein